MGSGGFFGPLAGLDRDRTVGPKNPPDPIRVVIAGGGTGGHLYPGIAVAREVLAREPGAQISFAGTARGIESRVVPREGFALDVIRSGGLKGKSPVEWATGLLLLPLSVVDAPPVFSAPLPGALGGGR